MWVCCIWFFKKFPLGLETLAQGLQNSLSLLCHNSPGKHSMSARNTRVKFAEVSLILKDNHSVLHTAPQWGTTMLAGTNHGIPRISVGLSTRDYDWAGMKIRHHKTVFPKPLYRGFYSENVLSTLRTHDSETNASGWKSPTRTLKYAKHFCILTYFVLWFNPQIYPYLVEHLNANARGKKNANWVFAGKTRARPWSLTRGEQS